ncbi:unnamed protein product [Bursaphelenchus okinawaensis]|uniref:PDZ domain-containing protein n=1 Tax=Bursaphelenchus okinawaensis TaxID=465554 RepID=A0A811JT38_9BILA|nr:unnamed protein product [Bursaphelenchus okinawaensis]CAG9081304.1 unnamed protein product [Bursaphelenchus okinawaensis]
MSQEITLVAQDPDLLNFQMDYNLIVTYIHPYCLDNKLRVGDRLSQVDGTKVSSIHDLPDHVICRVHFKTTRLIFLRESTEKSPLKEGKEGKKSQQDDASKLVVPSNTLTSTTLTFDIHSNKSARFGLVLKEKKSSVYVYRTANCSLSCFYFYAGDRIVEVNGTKLEGVDHAKKVFAKAFESTKPIKITLERTEGLDDMLALSSIVVESDDKKTITKD